MVRNQGMAYSWREGGDGGGEGWKQNINFHRSDYTFTHDLKSLFTMFQILFITTSTYTVLFTTLPCSIYHYFNIHCSIYYSSIFYLRYLWKESNFIHVIVEPRVMECDELGEDSEILCSI